MKLSSAPAHRLSVLLVCLALGACWGGDDDPNGVAREEFEARRDRIAPTLALASPTSAASMESLQSTLALAGTASDDRVISRVTWVNDRGGSGLAYQSEAAASVTWSASNIALAEGVNNIVLRAYDRAGNSATRALQVNHDPQQSHSAGQCRSGADRPGPAGTCTDPRAAGRACDNGTWRIALERRGDMGRVGARCRR